MYTNPQKGRTSHRQPCPAIVSYRYKLKGMLSLIPALCILQGPVAHATDVKVTIENYARAAMSYDVAKLDALLAPDYLEVSPLGELDLRDKVLSFYRVPADQRPPLPTALELTEWNLRSLSPDLTVAVYRENLTVNGKDKPMTLSFRVTTILKREKAGWKLVSNHFNGIRTKP
jgi:ketosteroid isomerase-like protein